MSDKDDRDMIEAYAKEIDDRDKKIENLITNLAKRLGEIEKLKETIDDYSLRIRRVTQYIDTLKELSELGGESFDPTTVIDILEGNYDESGGNALFDPD